MKKRELNYPVILVLLIPFISLIMSFFLFDSLSWKSYLFLFVNWILMNASVVIGWHRYFSHQHFETYKWIEFLFLFFGSSALNGSAIEWASEHMSHHAFPEDEEKDPSCPKKGFFYSHIGWLCYKRNFLVNKTLLNNKLLVWQDKNWKWVSVIVGVIIPFIIYYFLVNNSLLEALLIGVMLRLFISQHTILLLNSWAHFFGQKDPENKFTARNSILVSILCFGDGYHLNHHKRSNDYRAGVNWYDLDFSKWIIYLGSKIGIFWNLKRN